LRILFVEDVDAADVILRRHRVATLTVIGTVLPFSTSGGMSSLTLPVRTAAPPVTLWIADGQHRGVASAGRTVTTGLRRARRRPGEAEELAA
jgi:hypothetical protein